MDSIKVPKHGGPDGQGLPRAAFDALVVFIKTPAITESEIKQAIELCFGASQQHEWNAEYAPELRKIIKQL